VAKSNDCELYLLPAKFVKMVAKNANINSVLEKNKIFD